MVTKLLPSKSLSGAWIADQVEDRASAGGLTLAWGGGYALARSEARGQLGNEAWSC
jgi:hypothetical protein